MLSQQPSNQEDNGKESTVDRIGEAPVITREQSIDGFEFNSTSTDRSVLVKSRPQLVHDPHPFNVHKHDAS